MLNFLFSFKGRTGRLGFIIIYITFSILFYFVSFFPHYFAYPLIKLQSLISLPYPLSSVLLFLYVIVPFWIYYAVQVKRMHDINKSGFWVLINFIPIIGFFIMCYFGLKKGTVNDNNYGKVSNSKG